MRIVGQTCPVSCTTTEVGVAFLGEQELKIGLALTRKTHSERRPSHKNDTGRINFKRHSSKSLKDSRTELSVSNLSKQYHTETGGHMIERGSVGDRNPLLSKSQIDRHRRISESGPIFGKKYSFQGSEQRDTRIPVRPLTQSFKDSRSM